MVVTCKDCGLTYDDVDRRVICPHPEITGTVGMIKFVDGALVEGKA